MIASFWHVQHGPWPGQSGPDTAGFRSAVDVLEVIERRISSAEADADDRTRYRIACATIERGARKFGELVVEVDADDLLAWMEGSTVRTVYPPDDVAHLSIACATSLDGSGPLAAAVTRACDRALIDRGGLVITVEPASRGLSDVVRSGTRPDRPAPARYVVADPELADHVLQLPPTADVVFAGDSRRLRSAEKLRQQIAVAIRTGQPLSVGSQAKHDVLTEVLRELHHRDSRRGAVRIMYATEASEGLPFRFGPLRPSSDCGGASLNLGLMSIRHTVLDADVSGYWFRNRLVSVPGRSQVESEAYCYRDSVPRLLALADRGITDLHLTHTGYEPAALGFYRAAAEVVAVRPLRIHPRYLGGPSGIRNGTPWPQSTDNQPDGG